ncbi:intimin/invasin family protein [Edwardsiella tarda]|uniref:invasin domain 3-containing protein n=1 Tax=Edwardsiella tarda TaxID=636 RepID=UPI001FA7AA2F|nr:invasin domain 3-containing protein [Edwardsiella tarda]UCQ19184.1 intimin/invasin family protein [Edwardsiella tarda]
MTGYRPVVALMLALLLGHPARAALNSTETVRGRAPTVSDVAIVATTGNPMEGDTLQSGGSARFADVDGDSEFNSLKQWYRSGGTTPVASGTSYRLTAGDAGHTLQFGYTPATDPSITDPAVGMEVRSTASAVVQGLPVASSTFTASKASVIADNSDSTVLTLTLKDSGNRLVTGIATRLSLEASVVSGFSGGAPALVQPAETAPGSGIYTVSVKSGSVGTINVTPKLNAGALSVTPGTQQITFVPPRVTEVSPVANAYSFANNSGFPTTGFANARFKVSLSDNNPTAYQWAVDGSNNGTGYTSVDTTGVVTLNTARSGPQVIQVKDKISGTVLASYTFTLNGWFTNNGNTQREWAYANTYCSTRGGLATRAQLTNGSRGVGGTRSVGNLWGEWGAMGSQGSGFHSTYYWTSEADGRYNHYVVYLILGNVLSSIDSSYYYVFCRQGL